MSSMEEKNLDSINRNEIASKLFELNPNIDLDMIRNAIDCIVKESACGLISGDRIEVRGFGSLSVKTRHKNRVRNPKTNEDLDFEDGMDINSVYFRASKDMLGEINN